MSLAELQAAIGPLETDEEEGAVRYLGWRRLVWRRFRRHPLALFGAVLLLFMIALAAVGPTIAPPPPPAIIGQLTAAQIEEATKHNAPPELSWRYLLGTDSNAVPVLRNVLIAGQTPLEIGILGALLASVIGIASGAVSGYAGGWVDTIWMRTTDAFLAMPFVPLLLLATTSLGVGDTSAVNTYIILFGLLGWPAVARLVRGYVLTMREWELTLAARAMGLSEPAIIFRHILPNVLGVMVVSFTLNVAVFIGAEVTLEFLGSPVPGGGSWGGQMRLGFNFLLAGDWWPVLFPGLAVLLVILSVNLLGDGLRDAIDAAALEPMVERIHGGRQPRRTVRILRPLTRRWRAGRTIAMRGIVAARRPAGRLRRGPLSALVRATEAADRRLSRPAPRLLAIGPVVLAFLACGGIVLAGKAPRTYAPDYAPPVHDGSTLQGAPYGARPLPGGGWALFSIDGGGRLAYRRLDVGGREIETEPVADRVGDSAEPAMASGGGRALGVWLAEGHGATVLRAAYLGAGRPTPFTVLSGETLQQPSVLAMPGGGFDILIGRQRGPAYDLYLVSVPAGAAGPALVRRLVKASDYAYLPRAVVDGSSTLDVLYMERCCNSGLWELRLARFTPAGTQIGKTATMAQINSLTPVSPPAPARVPPSWAMDVARAPDGSVWAVGKGDLQLFVTHLSAAGKTLLPAQPLCGRTTCLDAGGQLALVSERRQSVLFATTTSLGIGTHLYGAAFDDHGVAHAPERIAYDYSGGAQAMQAGAAGGAMHVIWQKNLYGGTTILESATRYPSPHAPDLITRLAMNVGPAPANLTILVLGAVAAGVPLAAINVFLLALLLLVWAIITRVVRGSVRWPLYGLVLMAVLLLIFTRSTATPGFVFVLAAWGMPYGAVAAIGAAFVAAWSGLFLLRHTDEPFRAAGMAIAAVYFIAVMAALVGIQAELAQI